MKAARLGKPPRLSFLRAIMRIFNILVYTVLMLSTSLACLSVELSIDNLQYASPEAAAKEWLPGKQTSIPNPGLVDGVKCLSFPCRFQDDAPRVYWDRKVSLDLSHYNCFSLRIKLDNIAAISMISLYFKSGESNNWYSLICAIPCTTEEWHTILIPKSAFACEGACAGWNDIRGIRLSVWKASVAASVVSLADFYASNVPESVNLLPNSSFEICSTENLPDFWGTGHWGLCSSKSVTDTPAWRERWGVDNKIHHSGTHSLRIVHTADIPELRVSTGFINTDPDKPYTLSVWLKSDKTAMPVNLAIGSRKINVTVDKTWKRYSVTSRVNSASTICIIQPEGEGVLWIDDTQFEQGDTATEYRPMITDCNLDSSIIHRKVKCMLPFKIKPGPDKLQVRIDEHRRFLVNGQPFIPIAIGWESNPTPEIIHEIASAGFNSICFIAKEQPVEELRKSLDIARDNGLKVILWIDSHVKIDTLRYLVESLKDHPALIAWYVYDEPQIITSEIRDKYDITKKLDPTRPVYINYCRNYSKDMPGDIASFDYYPIPSASPACVIGNVDTMERCGRETGKPSWIWLQTHGYAYFYYREPSGPEEECMTYLSLIHGARGIKYFAQKPHSAELWDELKQLALEVRILAPVLYSLEEVSDVKADKQSIHLTTKRYKGKLYIITVNDCPEPVKASFSIANVKAAGAEVLFEDRKVTVKNGRFTDHYLGYQRHVYRISAD